MRKLAIFVIAIAMIVGGGYLLFEQLTVSSLFQIRLWCRRTCRRWINAALGGFYLSVRPGKPERHLDAQRPQRTEASR